jgi:hypothetical protein
MIRAVKDTNTGAVYEWVKTDANGVETWVNIPEKNWKREQEWTSEEIEALFSTQPQDNVSNDLTSYTIDD